MAWNIVQLIFPVLLAFLPSCLYRKEGRRMSRFYLMMSGLETARKFYARLLVAFLLTFHFVYAGGHPGEYGILLSTVLSAQLYPSKRADRWLRRIHESRKSFVLAASSALAAAFIPHLYTTAVTMGFLLLAASLYPSCAAVSGWKDEKTRDYWTSHPDVMAGYYY